MDILAELKKRSLTLMTHPRVMQAAQDPRVVKLMMQTLTARGRAQAAVDARVEQLAHSMNLVTKKELRELRRNLKRMERQLDAARRQLDEAQGKDE